MNKGKVKFELNKSGVRQLLKSPEMMAALKSNAQAAGYKVEESYTGYNRCKLRATGGRK